MRAVDQLGGWGYRWLLSLCLSFQNHLTDGYGQTLNNWEVLGHDAAGSCPSVLRRGGQSSNAVS